MKIVENLNFEQYLDQSTLVKSAIWNNPKKKQEQIQTP